MSPIWGGSRVKTTADWRGTPKGSTGTNLGQREGLPGALTLLVRLDDGGEVRLPLLLLEPIKEAYVPDGIDWKADIPESGPNRHIRTVAETEANGYRYWLKGSSERWFVVREQAGMGVGAQMWRTPFFPNQRRAHEVFTDLTNG